MDKTVTTTMLVNLFGVSDRTIRDLAKRGIIVRQGRGFALMVSVRPYCAHLRDLATGRGGETAIASTSSQ